MKTKKILTFGAIAALAFSITISGCKKKEAEDRDTESANDNQQSEQYSNDIVNMADEAEGGNTIRGYDSPDGILSHCVTVTHSSPDSLQSINTSDTITIDFGTNWCLGHDNRERKGKIIIIRTGKRFLTGSSKSVTFDGYGVKKDANVHMLEGTHTIACDNGATAYSNGAITSNGNMKWTVTASNMKITRQDGKWTTWSSTRTREWIAGSSTVGISPWKQDDIYLITGSANGSNSGGKSYTAVITSTKPLRRELSCKWFVSGEVTITPSDKPARILDFGSGTCDDQATVTVNGISHPIILH